MATKNSLTISADGVLFLRGVVFNPRNRPAAPPTPAILRGLLTLELTRPTRITSIEVELSAKASLSIPDNTIVSRRAEIAEESKVFSATQVFFRAPTTHSSTSRRTLSVDPGLRLYRDERHEHDRAVRREPAPAYTPPGVPTHSEHGVTPHMITANDIAAAMRGRERTRRRQSADFSTIHQEDYELVHGPVAARRPSAGGSRRQSHQFRPPSTSSPYNDASPTYTPDRSPVRDSAHPFTFDEYEARSRSVSRPASRTRSNNASQNASRAPSLVRARPPALSAPGSSFHGLGPSTSSALLDDDDDTHSLTRPPTHSRGNSFHAPLASPSTMSPISPTHREGTESPRDRGRKSALLTLSAVSNSILDAVKEHVHSNSPTVDKHQPITHTDKGKEREKAGDTEGTWDIGAWVHHRFSSIHKEDDRHEHKEVGNGWKEFKKGTYTFPISFSVPSTMPATTMCPFSSLVWRLKAQVHRPGVLTPKMVAHKDIIVVATPSEDDTEDTENVVLDRFWDDQMQYLLTISGRMFTVGGAIPIELSFLPLTKLRIYRLSVFIEEKVEYITSYGKWSLADPPARFMLLALRDKEGKPILPVNDSSHDALAKSPLRDILSMDDTDPHAKDAALARLIGPGPWQLSMSPRVPRGVHPSTANQSGKATVGHTLKLVFRLERGDDAELDPKSGRRKLFEITVNTPVYILSALADSKFTHLPQYSEATPAPSVNESATSSSSSIPQRVLSHRWSSTPDELVYDRFERLISGQVSEVGEAPPAYMPSAPTTPTRSPLAL